MRVLFLAYPFGMLMLGRSFSSPSYRYGFNGQEKDDEVSGSGNTNTAEFWEYDCRLGRRWNVDPMYKHFESPYSTFSNNPIINIDPLGNTDYFNNKGNYIGTDGVDNKVNMMALSKKSADDIKKKIVEKKTTEIVNLKDVIKAPTSAEVGAMKAAWAKTEKGVSKDKATGHEEGFVSGGGKITEAEPGQEKTLPDKASLGDKLDAAAGKNGEVDLVVHTHPNVQLKTDEGMLVSAAEPSPEDISRSADYETAYGKIRFAVVGVNIQEVRGVLYPTSVKVAFFNSTGSIGTIDLKKLEKGAKKIEAYSAKKIEPNKVKK